jgi:hypothetical protein
VRHEIWLRNGHLGFLIQSSLWSVARDQWWRSLPKKGRVIVQVRSSDPIRGSERGKSQDKISLQVFRPWTDPCSAA